MESISLDEYIRKRVYSKTETYTQEEVITAINNLTLIQVVPSLPTENIRENQLYLVLNNKNLPSDWENRYDLYIYVNNKWEQIDSIEFDIDKYPTSTQVSEWLNLKSPINHGHETATYTANGFMDMDDKQKLDTVEEGATKTLIDTTPTNNSNNAITSNAVYNGLNGKAPTNHRSKNTTYGISNNEYYGHSKASNTLPLMDGAIINGSSQTQGYVGTDNGVYARADHIHPTDTTRASNASATQLSAGLMSATDKTKLDNIIISNTVENNDNIVTGNAVANFVSETITTGVTVDTELNNTSKHPVENRAIKKYVDDSIENINLTIDETELLTKLNNLVTNLKTL